MTGLNSGWEQSQRRRWMRHDAQRWIRPDAHRWMRPGFEHDIALQLLDRKYSPDQPRVPAGNPDGGQWTSAEWLSAVRTAGSGRPPIGRAGALALAAKLAFEVIKKYRTDSLLFNLFGEDDGTVALTTIRDKEIFGVNSTSPAFGEGDDHAAKQLRDILSRKYPGIVKSENIGWRPSDAIFHAETTALLRAAKANGGSLAGHKLEVFVDRPMCVSCDVLLPLIGLELGNPRVTFVGRGRAPKTMRDGIWMR